MSGTTNIFELLNAGMRAENLRRQTIASNVANLNTPGYKSIDVKFEKMLAEALESPKKFDVSEIEPELFRPETTDVKANGNDVNFENQIGKLMKNSLRHKTYVRLLNHKYRQMEMAMKI